MAVDDVVEPKESAFVNLKRTVAARLGTEVAPGDECDSSHSVAATVSIVVNLQVEH